jgi:hypothetical protein
VVKELARLHANEDPMSAPYFYLRLTIWELKEGRWEEGYKALEGFPHCSATEITVNKICRIGRSFHMTPLGPTDRDHRAIEVRQYFTGLGQASPTSAFAYQNSINKLLSDEGLIDEVFACFEAYSQ